MTLPSGFSSTDPKAAKLIGPEKLSRFEGEIEKARNLGFLLLNPCKLIGLKKRLNF